MAYSPFTWHDGPNGGTPIIAARLNAIEQGIFNAAATADAASQPEAVIDGNNPSYGVPTDGSTNAWPALSALVTQAQNSGSTLVLPNWKCVINQPLTWSLALGSLRGGANTVIDASGITASGAVLNITGQGSNSALAHEAQTNTVSGFTLKGPTSSSTTVGGILVSDTAGIDQGTVENIIIDGFQDALELGVNTWAMDFRKLGIRHYQRHGIYMAYGRTNSGELQSFYGCTIYNSGSSAVAGIRANGGLGAAFYGCRFDYTTLPALIEQGRIAFYGGHFEDDNDQNMFQIAQGASGQTGPVQVDFHSVQFQPTGTKSAREIVHVNSSSGAAVGVNFFGGQVVYKVGNEVLFNDNSGHSITPGKYGIKYISNSGSTITAA